METKQSDAKIVYILFCQQKNDSKTNHLSYFSMEKLFQQVALMMYAFLLRSFKQWESIWEPLEE